MELHDIYPQLKRGADIDSYYSVYNSNYAPYEVRSQYYDPTPEKQQESEYTFPDIEPYKHEKKYFGVTFDELLLCILFAIIIYIVLCNIFLQFAIVKIINGRTNRQD